MMQLGTRLECIESSLRVSGVCQDGAREFARRRLRLTGRLSEEAEKLVGSSDDAVGARWEFVEGIVKLARNTQGDRRRKTIKLIERMTEVARLLGVRSIVRPDGHVWL
ncbi:hypothetical protein GW17_00052819 [Ensete ventricosum]|uniref:Uncharacterized protein n=1 Tax=Ensete ventricosum TaxID=4639 RepID=A0A444CHU4_ENSVE|nr:hypothetical protein GW17_00052819 [Ensete ventricosum]RZR74084.1 hypothetical protein BHM03_00031789 [Ensete ventricosum]